MTLASAAGRLGLIWRVLQMRSRHISFFGDREARAAYRYYATAHGRTPFLRKSTFGMALMPLPLDRENPFQGPQFENFRRRRRRAIRLGYTFAEFEGAAQVESMLAIHSSVSERQSLRMAHYYTDPAAVARYAKLRQPFYGVFGADGVLRAYSHAPVVGETADLARILGHHSYLKDGIMYFLIWELAMHLARQRNSRDYPRWISYGSYLSCRKEMRIFKKECGFRPHRAVCRWLDEIPPEYDGRARVL